MLLPLVRTLQKAFPAATLTWVIAHPAYALVEKIPGIEFIVLHKPRSIRDYWRFKKSMRNRTFDVLLATQANLRANLLYSCITAKRKIGYDRKRAKDGHGWFIQETITPGKDHTVEGFLKFALSLGVHEPCISWNLPVEDEDKAFAQKVLPRQRPLIAIHPASSKPERTWPVERYIALIDYLQKEKQATVVLVGGPGAYDKSLMHAILSKVTCLSLVGKTNLRQLVAVIQAVDVLICPDTGPAHMAAAVDTPVIALHAVTNPDVSGPYPFRHLAVNRYPQALRTVLHKEVTEATWGLHVHGLEAMQKISVEDVLEKLAIVL